MTKESIKTTTRISIIYLAIFPILTISYFVWILNTELFIYLRGYKYILYSCGIALLIGLTLALSALRIPKISMLGVVFAIVTVPCLFLSGIILIRDLPSLLDTI